ncbi:ComF family protein [Lihuaxuella thermophila]|uniref:ComF family protein n=1 Tax=Lihuaxuella thermophila TaxID=1173111 RepID=UPI000B7EAD65|nr:ComF family protein [Lihuaxuella thermophila]
MDWWSVLFPPDHRCWLCDSAPVPAGFWVSVREKVCAACREQLTPIVSAGCRVCGRSADGNSTGICPDCARVNPSERICNRSAVVYSDGAKQIIQLFKYRGKESLSSPLGVWMAEVAASHFGKQISLVTFVPLHPERLSERGFNQAELLANVIGKRLRLPVCSLLTRSRATLPQSTRTRQDRLVAMQNVFQLSEQVNPKRIENKRILIVDDVYTTGATLRECAKSLRQAGASHVCSVTFAR